MLHRTNYVVRVDACPQWNKYKAVTLAMCMGNDNWEGQKFITVLEWAERHFEVIRIALSDSLGRHNLSMTGLDAEQAEKLARLDGDAWIAQHQINLDSCSKKIMLVRWDHWTSLPEFQNVFDAFTMLSKSSGLLYEALEKDINTYRQRYLRRGLCLGHEFEKYCRAYLLEELAGTTLRARHMPNSCRVYPAAEPESSRLVRAGLIHGAPEGLENEYYVAINLRRRKQMNDYIMWQNPSDGIRAA